MTKKLLEITNKETVSPVIELFNLTGEMANEMFGGVNKILFNLQGNGFDIDFTQAVPKINIPKLKVRKPLMRYQAVYHLTPEADVNISVLRGSKKILTTCVTDRKKYKSTIKEIFVAILEDAGLQAKYYTSLAAQAVVNNIKNLEKEGKLNGAFYNIPEEGYHKCPGVSKSQISHLQKTYNHYLHNLENSMVPTEAMKLGTLVHMKILEPKR